MKKADYVIAHKSGVIAITITDCNRTHPGSGFHLQLWGQRAIFSQRTSAKSPTETNKALAANAKTLGISESESGIFVYLVLHWSKSPSTTKPDYMPP